MDMKYDYNKKVQERANQYGDTETEIGTVYDVTDTDDSFNP